MNISSKYNRSDYINISEVEGGVLERDLLLSNWDLFETKRPTRYVYLIADDVQRPDLFSFKLYSRMDWWWIVSKFNGIDDWWNDVFPGMRVSIPSQDDIRDFYLKVQARR